MDSENQTNTTEIESIYPTLTKDLDSPADEEIENQRNTDNFNTPVNVNESNLINNNAITSQDDQKTLAGTIVKEDNNELVKQKDATNVFKDFRKQFIIYIILRNNIFIIIPFKFFIFIFNLCFIINMEL